MTEAFLQYVWGQRLYLSATQTTVAGEVVEVLNPGRLNTDAGPDFFNAQVRVGTTTWAGNVEVHQTTDDWYRHGHDADPAYDNVILHVVGRSTSRGVRTSRGCEIPEVELRYDSRLEEHYDALVGAASGAPIRCAKVLRDIPGVVRTAWMDALLVERMRVKCDRALGYVDEFHGDLDQAFFCLLSRSLGAKVNAEPMEMMARATPLRILLKHNGPLQTEAILFGQSGLLGAAQSDEYVLLLRREYEFLRTKFALEPLDASMWKYARLRPPNFPDVRIAQLAAAVRSMPGNFQSSVSVAWDGVLEQSPSDYWDTHFRLGVRSKGGKRSKSLGPTARRLVMVNAVAPFALAEAERYDDEARRLAAVEMLRRLPTERNSILDAWAAAGLKVENEADAQALLHLRSEFCERGECLRCRFGHYAISRGVSPVPYVARG